MNKWNTPCGESLKPFSVYNSDDHSIFAFKCAPSPEILIRALKKHKLSKTSLKICYEASYIGYSLYRSLVKAGYNCQITAPSLIPKQPGFGQKTDKIDSKKLAIYYAKELLTFIHIPDLWFWYFGKHVCFSYALAVLTSHHMIWYDVMLASFFLI